MIKPENLDAAGKLMTEFMSTKDALFALKDRKVTSARLTLTFERGERPRSRSIRMDDQSSITSLSDYIKNRQRNILKELKSLGVDVSALTVIKEKKDD